LGVPSSPRYGASAGPCHCGWRRQSGRVLLRCGQVAQCEEPDLEILPEDHAARYLLASLARLWHTASHRSHLLLIIHRLEALDPSFNATFTTKLMHLHNVHSEALRKMRAAAAQAKADSPEDLYRHRRLRLPRSQLNCIHLRGHAAPWDVEQTPGRRSSAPSAPN